MSPSRNFLRDALSGCSVERCPGQCRNLIDILQLSNCTLVANELWQQEMSAQNAQLSAWSNSVNFCTYFGDQFITQTFAFLVERHCDFYCFVVKRNLPLVRGGSQCGNIGPCPSCNWPPHCPPPPECKPQNSRCVVVQFMFCCTVGWINWLIDWMNWLKIRQSY